MRVGLIGFGSIAEHGHLPALHSFPDIEVVAVSDVSAERLNCARAVLPNAAFYRSGLDLIADVPIDAVDICSPPHTHADLIVTACQRGIGSIVCEKPFVLSPAEYNRVARAREESGSRVVSVNNWVHSDLYRHVRGILDSGMIGDVRRILLRTERTGIARGNTGWKPAWRSDPAVSGGGIILDHGWHQLYLVLGWTREPLLSVRAHARTVDPRNYPVEDDAAVDLEFPSASARIELTWTANGRSNDGHIEGTRGEIAIYDDRILARNDTEERELRFAGRLTQSSYHPDWFEKMFAAGVLAPDRTEADRNFVETGIIVGAVAAAYHSARHGNAQFPPAIAELRSGEELSGGLRRRTAS